jgi:hypothetical protein
MATLLSKSVYRSAFAKVTLLGLMAFCGAAGPALGQETVGGKFTLTENTRFGKKFLPAGTYKFSVEPVGVLQSISSVQSARQVVQVIVRPEAKAAPVAILFAMATRRAPALNSSKLVLEPVNKELVMQSMFLEEQGLVLDFEWLNSKDKTPMLAQTARPETGAASKATD